MKINKLISLVLILSIALSSTVTIFAEDDFTLHMTNDVIGLPVNTVFSFTASKNINPDHVSALVKVTDRSGNEIEKSVAVSGTNLTVTPARPLDEAGVYGITFHDALQSTDGTALTAQKSFSVETIYPQEILMDLDSPYLQQTGGISSVTVKGYENRQTMYNVSNAVYTPNLPAPGKYNVQFWAVDWDGQATAVNTQLYVAGETITGPIMNLAESRGGWVNIGTYEFAATRDEFFSAMNPGRICCVKFTYIPAEPTLSFDSVVYPSSFTNVSTAPDIVIRFSNTVDLSTFGNTYFEAADGKTTTVTAYAVDKDMVMLRANTPLAVQTDYTLWLSNVRSLQGAELSNPQEINFTTRDYSVTAPAYAQNGEQMDISTEVTTEGGAALLTAWTDENGYVTDIAADEKTENTQTDLGTTLGSSPTASTLHTLVLTDIGALKPIDRQEMSRTLTLTQNKFDSNTYVIHIAGTLDEGVYKGQLITVMLCRNETEIRADTIQYIHTLDVDGTAFDLDIAFPAEAMGGRYDIFVGGTGIDQPAHYDFYYITAGTIAAARTALNDAGNATEAEAVILENHRELGLDGEFFAIFADYAVAENKTDSTSPYAQIMAAMLAGDFVSVEDAAECFARSVLFAYLKNTDFAAMQAMLEGRGDVLGVYTGEHEAVEGELVLADYKKIDDTSVIYKNIAGKFESIDEFKNELACAYAVALLDAATWGEIAGIINDYNNFFGLDLTDYNRLSTTKQKEVRRSIATADLSDLSKIRREFQSAVAEAKQTTSGGPSSDTGGKKTGNVTVPMGVTPPVLNTDVIYEASENKNVAFTDLAEASWAESDILELAAQGIVSGYGDGLFKPNKSVTREQFVKMLISAFDILDLEATSTFNDVRTDNWSYYYVSTAAKLGIVQGVSKIEFGYGKLITRQEMAVMLVRTLNYLAKDIPANSALVNFRDAKDISSYAVDAVEALYKAGIMAGTGDDMFSPVATATRAMAARVIKLAMNL